MNLLGEIIKDILIVAVVGSIGFGIGRIGLKNLFD